MMYMDAGIEMDTVFGDGSAAQQRRPVRQAARRRQAAGHRRVAVHHRLHQPVRRSKLRVAFAAPYPGKILPMDLRQLGGTLICQKDAFLCAARGVSLGIAFQQKLSVGLLRRRGLHHAEARGDGLAFVHAGGTVRRGASCSPARRCWSTPAASSPSRRTSISRSSTSARSRPRCSAARACSSPRSPARARCGCRACRSRAWRRASSPPRRSAAARAKRVGCSADSAAGGLLGGVLGGGDDD